MLLEGKNAEQNSIAPSDLGIRTKVAAWMDRWSRGILVALVILVLIVACFFVASPNRSLSFMNFLFDNLPLTLPILTVVLTVLLRPDELAEFSGWLRLATPFGLGLVSFSIWAYVAGQGVDQYIMINSSRVLNKNHALLLLIISFILASFYSVVTVLAEKSDPKNKRPWQYIQGFQLAISAALLILPFFLFEDKSAVEKTTGRSFDTRQFTVAIPFRDASLNQHLGTSTDPLTECFSQRHVSAKSAAEAIQKARQLMDARDDLVFRARGAAPEKAIEVLDSLVVAQEEK